MDENKGKEDTPFEDEELEEEDDATFDPYEDEERGLYESNYNEWYEKTYHPHTYDPRDW